ncbi:MAG: hypothetical protein JO001_08010 [Alphaproteobacteria bacterium]|nr:hypothetical protein [Alphaproteobacteria bacterium]
MRDELWLGRQLAVQSGFVWLAEQAPGAPLFAVDRAAVADANIIIYDRGLEDALADILPLGSYAEPRPAIATLSGPAIAPRATQFAGEGWSVVQLVERSPASRLRWRNTAGELLRVRRGSGLSVVALAKSPLGPIRRDEGSLDDLPRLLDEAGDDFLTLVCGPLSPAIASASAAAPATLFTASGLAG